MPKRKTRAAPPVTETDPRTALAAAVRRHSAATKAVPAIRSARSKLAEQIIDAVIALDKAKEAVEAAKEKAAQHCANLALGKSQPAPKPSIEQAEARLRGLQNDIDTMHTAAAALAAREQPANNELEIARMSLRRAIGRVLADEAPFAVMVERYQELHRSAFEIASILTAMSNAGGRPAGFENWHHLPDCPGSKQMAEWKAAIVALETDAAAALPGSVTADADAA